MIKDGKLVYPEKKLRMNNHEVVAKGSNCYLLLYPKCTANSKWLDMVEFRKCRATLSRTATTNGISNIPENFHPLIALLVQDRYYDNLIYTTATAFGQCTKWSPVMRPLLHYRAGWTTHSVNLKRVTRIPMSQVLYAQADHVKRMWHSYILYRR
jgi:hypothetical protein